jgi:hypothetical protein
LSCDLVLPGYRRGEPRREETGEEASCVEGHSIKRDDGVDTARDGL